MKNPGLITLRVAQNGKEAQNKPWGETCQFTDAEQTPT